MIQQDKNTIIYLTMIQAIIARLETNCFMLKTLAMTLAVAILAFIGSIDSPKYIYLLAGYLPIIVFWVMDARYLHLGRVFRQLYESVRLGEDKDLFSMKIKPYIKQEQSILRVAASWSILWFYLSILITFTSSVLYIYTET